MKEVKIRGRELAVHLSMMGVALLRKEKDHGGHIIYVYALDDKQIAELNEYVQNKQKRNYY